jgi:D-beta-D-heptose 7-phosphate kinase/D-beta-D-heptose 1-phosphate adenosyltransferase
MSRQDDISRLLGAVDRFRDVKVLVVGDVMLDEFIWGRVDRISPEAPVPVVDVTEETRLLGGAANVINNIVTAGGRALLAGVVGRDRHGKEIARKLEERGVDPGGLIDDSNRPTTRKTRVVAHNQQVVRFDRESRAPLRERTRTRILEYLERSAEEADAVVISDYGKGVVDRRLVDEVTRLFVERGRVAAVDPKVSNFHLYRRVSVITPNHHEAALGAGVRVDTEEDLVRAGFKIIDDLDCEAVLVTRGEQGMSLFEQNRTAPVHIPTVAREVFDVTGAGDTVIAVYTMGRAAGLSRVDAAALANYAAGVVVGEVGTSAVTAEGLKQSISNGRRRRR